MAVRLRRPGVTGVAPRRALRGARRAASPYALPLSVFALTLLIPITLLVVSTWLAGWRLQPERTTSMEPTYRSGSLLAVEPIDPSDVRRGSVIVFEDPNHAGRLVAHRVISVPTGKSVAVFHTKGDANISDDPYALQAKAIRGRVRWSIAGLGRATTVLVWPTNAIVLIGVPAVLLLGTEIAAWTRKRPDLTAGAPS